MGFYWFFVGVELSDSEAQDLVKRASYDPEVYTRALQLEKLQSVFPTHRSEVQLKELLK